MLHIPFDDVENRPVTEYTEKLNLSINLLAGIAGGKFELETIDNKKDRAEKEWKVLKPKLKQQGII